MKSTTEFPVHAFASAKAWQQWLAKHHKTSDGIWLRLVRLPPARKTVAVRVLLDALGGSVDGEVDVSQSSFKLGNNDIDFAARLITGKAGCHLPVVYVSCDFDGKYLVSPDQLAFELSGMAHVIVEPNRPFSRRLKIEVASENVYGGTVGIYWPEGAGRRKYFLNHNREMAVETQRSIVDEVRTALTNRRPLVRCSWSAIQEATSRDALQALKSSGSVEVEKYVDLFDAEMRAKAEQLQGAEAEIARLGAEIRRYEAQASSGAGVALCIGGEYDLYPGEMTEVVYEAMQDAMTRVETDSRRGHVLKAILDTTPFTGSARRQREELKELLRNYRSMDPKIRKGLESLGFSIEDEGKHYKIIYAGDDRYIFSLAKTGSDHRGGLNAASDISKRVF